MLYPLSYGGEGGRSSAARAEKPLDSLARRTMSSEEARR